VATVYAWNGELYWHIIGIYVGGVERGGRYVGGEGGKREGRKGGEKCKKAKVK